MGVYGGALGAVRRCAGGGGGRINASRALPHGSLAIANFEVFFVDFFILFFVTLGRSILIASSQYVDLRLVGLVRIQIEYKI